MRMLLCACLLASSVRAEDVGDDARARAHFEAGRALYSIGNYEESLREFLTGYQILPKPKFLLNIAQSYRKMGQLTRARAMCTRYLAEESPAERQRIQGEVDRLIHEIDEELAARPPDVPQVTPAPQPLVVVTQAPPPKKSFIRRHWWIIPTVTVAAAGLAVGLYFGLRPTMDCGSAGFGCVKADP
jgi:tetratricopeptide (TPR) repeat protein